MTERSSLSPDRFFSAEPAQRKIARQLYDSVLNLPILCPVLDRPHIAEPGQDFTSANPCELIVLSDDYLVHHLTSLGVNLGPVPSQDGAARAILYRQIWQSLADNLSTLRGLPADVWLSEILFSVFNVKEKLNSKNAQRIYDVLSDCLRQPEFRLSRLIERFNIECLGLVESPTNPTINLNRPVQSGSRIIPCFNPDSLFEIHHPDWCLQIEQLSHACQIPITDYSSFLRAVHKQLLFFKSLGATTVIQTIHASAALPLTSSDPDRLFTKAISRGVAFEDACQFASHMLLEMASMSIEDNLVLHVQVLRDCSQASIPLLSQQSSTNDLLNYAVFNKLLERFGQDPHLVIILADERSLSEPLVNLVSGYPAIKVGTPRTIFNGLSSLHNYFAISFEGIGLHKSAGLTGRYTSFLLLPSQHDIWRRSSANWLANLVCHGLLDLESAYELVYALAYGLTKSAYRL